jgi:hypothetical protein
MAIVDAQFRLYADKLLEETRQVLNKSEIPTERFENIPQCIYTVSLNDHETGKAYYCLVYVAISEDQQAIQKLTAKVMPPDARQAGPR